MTNLCCKFSPPICLNLIHILNQSFDAFTLAIEQACTEVHRVVLELQVESIYPSEARVLERMNKPGYLRYKKVRAALQEARVAAKT
jgi:hypothetical protein